MGPSKRSLLHTLERERDHAAADRQQLLAIIVRLTDQLCHLSGHPFVPPPIDEWKQHADAERRAVEADMARMRAELDADLVDPAELPDY